MWERNGLIRDRSRSQNCLLEWPEPRLVGAPSMRAFSMNRTILEITARWWCPQVDLPETVSVVDIRMQVGVKGVIRMNSCS